MISRKIKYILSLSAIFFCTAAFASASDSPIVFRFLGVPVGTIIERTTSFLLSIAGGIALLFLVGSGIYYMASNGSPDAQQKAKRMLMAAITGLIVILLSYIILMLIDNILVR